MKIGRNDPCPCGSGRKYKKCCLNKENKNLPRFNVEFLRESHSDFNTIEPTAKVISNIIKKYNFRDAVKAIFCLNLWRRNRSALAQGLSMNMALCICNSFGEQRIQTYNDLALFYGEISEHIQITSREDYIIDDYGEVFINHAGRSFPVIIGTGHQQVYAALRYLQTLVSNTGRNHEFITILEYLSTILRVTRGSNIPNSDLEITHELPSEEFWNSIKDLFRSSLFQSQATAVAQIMGHQFGPIEIRHFVKKEGEILPLYNSSILIDYYKFILNTVTQQEKDAHITQTIHSLIENTFNFSPNTPNRVLIDPMIINRESGEKIVPDGLIFAGFGSHGLLIALKADNNRIQTIIKSIDELNKSKGLRLVEPHYRKECHGAYGVDVKPNHEIIYMIIDPFTDITSHRSWFGDRHQEFKCTALDALYMIGFADNLGEVVDFIRYDNADETQIFSFGGKNNLFFTWKSANREISSGAIEYDRITLDFNTAEDFIFSYFSDKLCEFPRCGAGLFVDPLNWTVEDAPLGYKRMYHKGCHGFGGETKNLGYDIHVFLAHNVEFFTEADFAQNSHTALKTIDELNERLFLRYADVINNFDVLKGKTLQLLFMPWKYAKRNHSNTLLRNSTRNIVFSDEYWEQDTLIIRYSVDPEVIMSAIQNAPDRRAENTYFIELLQPLQKYSPEKYKLLESKLYEDASLKKTVGVFHIEQYYYFSDRSIDTNISAVNFVKARKEIAKVCLSSGVEPGEYRGKAATATIRKMQLSVVRVFENYLAEFDQFDLHKKILGYFSVQQNGIIVNIKRYTAFTDLDDEVQREFEKSTRKIREEYRRNAETAKYLLESNLAITHIDDAKKCSDEDFAFLIAFADWLVVLQDSADTCHYTDFDLSINVDSEYKVDTLLSEDTRARYDAILLRKYSTTDYHIKDDALDLEFFEKAIEAFNQDTGIDLSLLVSLIEYMQLGIIDDEVVTEIYPNVFEIEHTTLAQKFNEILEQPVPDLSIITNLIDFLTLNPSLLKTVNGKQHDLLPIWEREKRDNRFSVKPIVMHKGKCIFSPVAMNNVLTSWKSGITEWYLPYEIGLPELTSVLKQWKKRYEDEMVQDIAQLFRDAKYDLIVPEAELVYRFPNDNYPQELGDYDVIAISKPKHELWIIESKVLQKVGSIYEDQMQQKSFFYQHKDDEKFQRRIDYMLSNTGKVLGSFGVEKSEFRVVPYMVTNKLFASRYKKISFPIITFSELKQILAN